MGFTEELADEMRKQRQAEILANQEATDSPLGASQMVPPTPGQLLVSAYGGGLPQEDKIGPQGQVVHPAPSPADMARAEITMQREGNVVDVPAPPRPPPTPTTQLPGTGDVVRAQQAAQPTAPAHVGGGAPKQDPYLRELKLAFDNQAAGAQALGRGEMAQNAGVAAGLERRADYQQGAAQQEERIAREQDAWLKKHSDDIEAMSREHAQEYADPHRWARSQNIAAKTGYIAASFLGGISAALNHTPNEVVAEIHRNVDEDIDDQQKEIDAHGGRLVDMKGALAETYRRFGVSSESRAKARAFALGQIDDEMQRQAAVAGNPAIQARADIASAKIREAQARAMISARPKSGGGLTAKEIADKTLEVMKFDAQNGKSTTPEEARAKVIALYTGSAGAGGLAAKAGEGGAIDAGPAPKSTNWEPQRKIQGTDAQHNLLKQQQYNATVMGTAHKRFGARTPEAQREIMAGYIIEPDDSPETIKIKAEGFRAKFGGGGGPAAAGLPDGSDILGDEP